MDERRALQQRRPGTVKRESVLAGLRSGVYAPQPAHLTAIALNKKSVMNLSLPDMIRSDTMGLRSAVNSAADQYREPDIGFIRQQQPQFLSPIRGGWFSLKSHGVNG